MRLMDFKSNPHYPVQSLLGNITQTLMKLNIQYDLMNAINSGFKNEIKFIVTDKPVMEVAELNLSAQVKLYDNFCQFFWCLCFSSILFYDKGIIEKLRSSDFNGSIDMTNEDSRLAFSVFQAGVGLLKNKKNGITPRHVFFELPNPYNNINHEYVGKANNVYCYGIAFILHHEFSHFEFNHSINGSKEDEEVADSNSFWTLYSNVSDEEKITAIVGIILALCALIFIDNTMTGDETHPDGDIRVATVLENVDNDYDHYWGIACLSFKMWAFNYGFDKDFPNVSECDTWKDYFKLLLDYLQTFKSK